MKKSAALTLIELLVVVSILTLISGILVAIFINGWRNFNQQTVYADTQSQAKLIISTIVSEVRKADKVISTRTFGSDTYTSSSNTIILELASIDNNQNIILGNFDYEVFYLDPLDSHKLKFTREAAPVSARRSITKTVADLINQLTFTYHNSGDIEDTDLVTVSTTTAQEILGKSKSTSLTAKATLRNR